jgi:hypothetical protein
MRAREANKIRTLEMSALPSKPTLPLASSQTELQTNHAAHAGISHYKLGQSEEKGQTGAHS